MAAYVLVNTTTQRPGTTPPQGTSPFAQPGSTRAPGWRVGAGGFDTGSASLRPAQPTLRAPCLGARVGAGGFDTGSASLRPAQPTCAASCPVAAWVRWFRHGLRFAPPGSTSVALPACPGCARRCGWFRHGLRFAPPGSTNGCGRPVPGLARGCGWFRHGLRFAPPGSTSVATTTVPGPARGCGRRATPGAASLRAGFNQRATPTATGPAQPTCDTQRAAGSSSRGAGARGAGELAGLGDEPVGGVPDLGSPPRGSRRRRCGWTRRSAASPARAGPARARSAPGSGVQPSRPRSNVDRRERVDGEQQQAAGRARGVGHPEPALDPARARTACPAPSRRTPGRAAGRGAASSAGVLHEVRRGVGCRDAPVRRRQVRRGGGGARRRPGRTGRGRRTSPARGSAPPSPVPSCCTREAVAVDMLRPVRSTSVRTTAGPGRDAER